MASGDDGEIIREGGSVTAVSVDQLRRWGAHLEKREAERSGGSRADARSAVARRARVAPGFLENLARDRVKEPSDRKVRGITGLIIRELEAEIARLTHDLEIARLSADRLDASAVSEAETALRDARKALTRIVR